MHEVTWHMSRRQQKKKNLRYNRDGQSRQIAINRDESRHCRDAVAIRCDRRDSSWFIATRWTSLRFGRNCSNLSYCNCFLGFFFCNNIKRLKTFHFVSFFLSFFFLLCIYDKKNVVTKKCVDLLRYTNKKILISLVWVLGWWVFSW